MYKHQWMLEVLDDLRAFAVQNDLQLTGTALDRAIIQLGEEAPRDVDCLTGWRFGDDQIRRRCP